MAKRYFVSRVVNTPKMKALRKKIRAAKLVSKRLGTKYRRLYTKEARRLSK